MTSCVPAVLNIYIRFSYTSFFYSIGTAMEISGFICSIIVLFLADAIHVVNCYCKFVIAGNKLLLHKSFNIMFVVFY